jgi:hypothetical protein
LFTYPFAGALVAPAVLSELAAEYPGYEFAFQQTCGGVAIVASRRGGCARPGLSAVITDDLDEMRRALASNEESGCLRVEPDGGWR